MAKEIKQYKLKRGYHRYPNPEFDPNAKPAQMVESHIVAKMGDKVPLSDSQYAAFQDRFEPAEGEASEVRDRENEKMERAKQLAEELGESVDPNVVRPIDSPTTWERNFQGVEAGRAGMVPMIADRDRKEAEEIASRRGVPQDAASETEEERARRQQEAGEATQSTPA